MKRTLKKTIALTLALIMALGVAPLGGMIDFDLFGVSVNAASESNLTFELINDDTEYEVSDCDEEASGELIIPSTYNGLPVASIGIVAFFNCKGLTSITIPDSITSISDEAFYNCTSLTSITVSSNNSYYSSDEYGVLYNKDKTELIQYPIGNKRDLFEIPDSVTSIGWNAFDYTALYDNNSNWDNGVLYIGNCLIKANEDLSGAYTIKEGTKILADFAFDNCTGLTSMTIPDSVTSIGGWIFEGCTALESVSIGSGVTSGLENAFWDCSSLTNITVSSDNAYYSNDENGILYNKDKTELILYPFGSERTSFQIPNSVTNIAPAAFYGCRFLQEICVDSSSKSFSSKDGVLFNKDKTSLVYYPCSKADVYYEVPKGVTDIRDYAFSGNTNCENLVIPDSVTYIGYGVIGDRTIIFDGSVEQWRNVYSFGVAAGLIVAKQNLSTRILTAFLKMMLKILNKLNFILISMQ